MLFHGRRNLLCMDFHRMSNFLHWMSERFDRDRNFDRGSEFSRVRCLFCRNRRDVYGRWERFRDGFRVVDDLGFNARPFGDAGGR